MKYPQQQLEVLQSAIKELSKDFEVKNINPSHLHFMVYQQGSEGQKHNWLYTNGTEIKKGFQLTESELTGYKKLIEVPTTFEIYPEGCNDNHIETAVKYCLKSIV